MSDGDGIGTVTVKAVLHGTGEEGLDAGWDGQDEPGFTPFSVVREDNTFEVFLPHQCEAWSIASGSWEDAEAQLATFVKQAEEALRILRLAQPGRLVITGDLAL